MPKKRRRNKHISKQTRRNVSETAPKISVVIPAYNSAEYICETLDSVIGQTYREHEIIVVNDGSPDTEELERAIGPRLDDIIYIKQQNTGAGVARNTGIEHARGEIIAFLDADDIWLPDFLASQLGFLERHGYDMVYCDAFLFGMDSANRTFMETAPSVGEANFESILDLRCNVITSGTMARKQAIIDVGMFENENVRAHDFILWLKMAKNGAKIGYQRKQLLKYRERLDSLSGDSITRVEREHDAFERVARGYFDLTAEQKAIVEKHLADLEANLAVEQGKAFLLNGDFREAGASFRVANRHRESLKLTTVTLLTRVAPRTLLKYYRSRRAAEIAFITPHKKSSKAMNKLKRLVTFWYVISDHMVEALLKF